MLRFLLAMSIVAQVGGARVAGSVVFDGTSAAPVSVGRVRILLARPEDAAVVTKVSVGLLPLAAIPGATVADGGSFLIEGLSEGPYFPLVMFLPPPWKPISVVYEGHDISEEGLSIKIALAATSKLTLTFSDRPTAILGKAQSRESGMPAAVSVVAFPQSAPLRLLDSRRIKKVAVAGDGAFLIQDLPPGHYFLAVSNSIRESDLRDGEYLEKLSRNAVGVTLADGQRLEQNMSLPR